MITLSGGKECRGGAQTLCFWVLGVLVCTDAPNYLLVVWLTLKSLWRTAVAQMATLTTAYPTPRSSRVLNPALVGIRAFPHAQGADRSPPFRSTASRCADSVLARTCQR